MTDLTDLLDDVLYVHQGRISTHYADCYKYHAGCLASLVRDRLEDHIILSNN